jgi:hypothetical protein
LNALKWVFVGRKRYAIYKKSRKDVLVGNIVVTDRFPHKAFWCMTEPMDGPRLGDGGPMVTYLARMERCYYDKIYDPDKVVVLKAPIEVLRKRKNNLDPTIHDRKVKAVNSVEENREKVIGIDASRDLDSVLLEVKRAIWACL